GSGSVVGTRRVAPAGSAASVYAGAGGSGSRISISRSTSLGSAGGGFGAYGIGMGGYGAGTSSSLLLSGSGVVQNEKETMQELNERLATYLEQVRSLEQQNRQLERQIRDFMQKKGPSSRDWSHYWELIEELRGKTWGRGWRWVGTRTRTAADAVSPRYEAELAIRLSVESDIVGLRKVIDDTNMARLQLEGEIESLKEELIFMKKNHED
ncbi:K1C18 protein, partial [Nothoprocta pentlandii]|nr:K1C18 protein [Nothoprocta pentlandii]